MKFRLEIELGNDAMQSFYDVCGAINEATGTLTDCIEPMQAGERGTVVDGNGNTVGKWEVIEEVDEPEAEANPAAFGYNTPEEAAKQARIAAAYKGGTWFVTRTNEGRFHEVAADQYSNERDGLVLRRYDRTRHGVIEQDISNAKRTPSPMRAFMDAQRDMANPPVHIGTEIEENAPRVEFRENLPDGTTVGWSVIADGRIYPFGPDALGEECARREAEKWTGSFGYLRDGDGNAIPA